jgi:gliding motility-associated-like protein
MRDLQIVVDNCVPLPIVSQLDSLSITDGNLNNDTVMTCPGSNLSFCFDITDQVNPAAHVYYDQSNFSTVMPGSQITTTNPTQNTLRVCITWPVTLADTGLHMLTVWVNDTIDCLTAPGFSTVPIYVRKPMTSGGDTSICHGDTTQLWVQGNGVYAWSVLPGGDDLNSLSCLTCANPDVWPDKTTSYVITDVLCGYQDTVVVTVYESNPPIPEFIITPDITTLANPDLELKNYSQHALYYRWYDSTHTYLGNSVDLSITATEVGNYCYTLEAENFCHVVRAKTHCAHVVGDGSLVFPTGFTPNQDGKNDVFHPIIVGDMSFRNYEMVIYNRWGMQLFKSKNIMEGWNGMFKGKECEADTYYYYVEAYHGVGEKVVYKGDVILIR